MNQGENQVHVEGKRNREKEEGNERGTGGEREALEGMRWCLRWMSRLPSPFINNQFINAFLMVKTATGKRKREKKDEK